MSNVNCDSGLKASCAAPGCHKHLAGGIHMACKHCGGKVYCARHRLPEDHACVGTATMHKNMCMDLSKRLMADAEKSLSTGTQHHFERL